MNESRRKYLIVTFGGLFLVAFAGPGFARMSGGMGGGGGMGGTAAYDTQFTTLHFSGSGNCKMCHNSLFDQNGEDVSIETSWSSTAMAHSARDPIWRAKLSSELARNPGLASVLNYKCSRCHAPMANTEAVYHGDAINVLGGLLTQANPYHDAAMDGVSCTLCHQIANSAELGTDAGYSGHYTIDTYLNAADRQIYGPYANVFGMPMLNMVSYTIGSSPHIKESTLCATCHNLYTPYVDETGKVISTPETEFPEQMMYSEWLASDYRGSQSCQDCHMPRTNGVVMASRPMWLDTRRDDFATHQLVGANTLLLNLLLNNQNTLGATVANMPVTMQETAQMQRSAAAVELMSGSLANNVLAFELRIRNLAGHKLPSGIPLRRLILHVKVSDPRGRIVFESGRINADGSVAGLDSDANQTAFEPHYELITSPDQVQAYEAVMINNLGEVTYTLLRAAGLVKDNRLLPAGFDKTAVSPDIRVAGQALADSDFIGGSDQIGFRLAGMGAARYTVSAELVYQPLSFAFLRDLKDDATPEISALSTMYEASTAKAAGIASATFQISR